MCINVYKKWCNPRRMRCYRHVATIVLMITARCWSHVPTYGSCVDNCCSPPHTHTTSQVIYLKGTGGLEIHVESDTNPFSTFSDEMIDFDVVFRDPIDPSTYALYVGCGGCAREDSIVSTRQRITHYQSVEIEPFTQTAYQSAFAVNQRAYPSSALTRERCPQAHFGIRLIDFMNRTDGKPIVWGAVVGLGESFTVEELFLFPSFILRNHGESWNDLTITYWLWGLIGAPLILLVCRFVLYQCGFRVLHLRSPFQLRELCYELALVGFLTAALEELTHLLYAQIGNPVKNAFWIGLLVVILLPQGLGIAFVYVVWLGLRHREDNWVISRPWWAPLEILTGTSFFFLFGAGFYVGPAAIIIAGILRCHEWIWGHAVTFRAYLLYVGDHHIEQYHQIVPAEPDTSHNPTPPIPAKHTFQRRLTSPPHIPPICDRRLANASSSAERQRPQAWIPSLFL